MARVRRRPAVRWAGLTRVGLAGLLGLAAGCVPNGGPVRQVRSAADEGALTALGIRVLAQPPAKGASPERLARAFLAACADPDNDFAVARQFLVPAEAKTWDPRRSVRIYDGDPSELTLSRAGSRLTVTAPATVATIAAGDYTLVGGGTGGGTNASLTFGLTRVDGEWRFQQMPDGLLLASSLQFAYKPVDVYFLPPQGRALVPDRVFLLAPRAELASVAVATLLRGPSPALAGAVRSAYPVGTRLRTAANVRGGVLSVDVITDAARLDRPAMAAQLLWTASQLPEVSGVRLRINGVQYAAGSVSLLEANPDALAYSPNVLPPTAPAYYVVPAAADHNLLVSTSGQNWRLSGDRKPLRYPALSVTQDEVAALSCPDDRCRSLYLGNRGRSLTRADLPVAGTLTAPTWDATGAVWTVDSARGRLPTVWRVPVRGRPSEVPTTLARGEVRVLRLSRDGARVAVIAANGRARTVLVGVVLRSGGTARIVRLRPVAPALLEAADLAWADAGHLAVLAKSDRGQGSVTPYRIRIDGSEAPQPVLGTVPGGSPVSIAAAPSQALLVATVKPGQPAATGVSALQGQVWRPLVQRGSDPVYPG